MARNTLTMGVEGGKELERKLEALAASVAGDKLEAATLAGADPILTAMYDRAPVKRGILKSHIGAEVVEKDRDHVDVQIGVLGASVAHLVEFGHQLVKGGRLDSGGHVVGHVPAHPFIRPAFDEETGAAVGQLADELRAQVEEAAR